MRGFFCKMRSPIYSSKPFFCWSELGTGRLSYFKWNKDKIRCTFHLSRQINAILNHYLFIDELGKEN